MSETFINIIVAKADLFLCSHWKALIFTIILCVAMMVYGAIPDKNRQ